MVPSGSEPDPDTSFCAGSAGEAELVTIGVTDGVGVRVGLRVAVAARVGVLVAVEVLVGPGVLAAWMISVSPT